MSKKTMQQANDFFEECQELDRLISTLSDRDFEKPTQFKNWTVNDVLVHLHFWNKGADLALQEPDTFSEMVTDLGSALQKGRLRDYESPRVSQRGRDLAQEWRSFYRDMAKRWQALDPKLRVSWAGPDMSVRTSISARQMETWAHGQSIFDLFGKSRKDKDRIKNIAILGVNAFNWSHRVQGLETPETVPRIMLNAPSGALWEIGDAASDNSIAGSAVEFCQVVTQTRNIADTQLQVKGNVADTWMKNAQCFAGPRETPPAPGTRKSN